MRGRKKLIIQTEQEALAYIEKVLNRWQEFGETHRPLQRALEIVLRTRQTDVAEEIFAEIEKLLKNQEAQCENKRLAEIGNWIFHEYLPMQFAELKKKYTEGEE